MRYEDWDILIFPRGSKTPVREFKTACHVVPDLECAYAHGSTGLPTLTCFIPSLPSGTPFTVSLHNWTNPEISRFTKSFSQHHDSATFEARISIDGRLVASRPVARNGPWPQLFEHSFEFTKDGACDFFKFPAFRSELLRQSYWNPADELGRIKIIISEGYPRDSASLPMERVKNIMAFSFQHAPLDILETAAIAWPNPSMWQRAVVSSSIPGRTFGNFEASNVHAHSPRFRDGNIEMSGSLSQQVSIPIMTSDCSSADVNDLLSTMPCTEALLHHDVSAPPGFEMQYVSSYNTDGAPGHTPKPGAKPIRGLGDRLGQKGITKQDRVVTENMAWFDVNMAGQEKKDQHMVLDAEGVETAAQHVPNAPANSPTTRAATTSLGEFSMDGSFEIPADHPLRFYSPSEFPNRFASTLTQSLLNHPAPLPTVAGQGQQSDNEVKSRKENRALSSSSSGGGAPLLAHNDMRKVSQSVLSNVCLSSTDSTGTSSSPGSRSTSGAFSRHSKNEDEKSVPSTTTAHFALQPIGNQTSKQNQAIGGKTSASAATEKGTKRTRQFTPASVRAIDEEDEPQRPSPRLRVVSIDEDE